MKELRIVCDQIPSNNGCVFVECEDETGSSIRAGEWRERPDGYAHLIVKMPVSAEDQRVDVANADAAGYRSAMEHVAPLIALIDAILGRRTDSLEVEAIQKELEAALQQFKGVE